MTLHYWRNGAMSPTRPKLALLELGCKTSGSALTPNPSLKLTRYGRHCKPGLSQSYYCLSPGLQYLPPRAA